MTLTQRGRSRRFAICRIAPFRCVLACVAVAQPCMLYGTAKYDCLSPLKRRGSARGHSARIGDSTRPKLGTGSETGMKWTVNLMYAVMAVLWPNAEVCYRILPTDGDETIIFFSWGFCLEGPAGRCQAFGSNMKHVTGTPRMII